MLKPFVIIVAVTLVTPPSSGEFILDGFDDRASMVIRDKQRVDRDWSFPVGERNDTRRMAELTDNGRGSKIITDRPTANWNIVDSISVMDLTDVPPRVLPGDPDFRAQYVRWSSTYVFINQGQDPNSPNAAGHTVDFTEGGQNDTIFLDFSHFTGTVPPVFRLGNASEKNWALTHVVDLPASDEPFTVAIPFSDFRDRGNVTSLADFSTVWVFDLDIWSSGFWDDATYDSDFVEDFSIGLDAIRVGALPEPALPFWFIFLSLGLLRRRRPTTVVDYNAGHPTFRTRYDG